MLKQLILSLSLSQSAWASTECLSLQSKAFEAQSKSAPNINISASKNSAEFKQFKPSIDSDDVVQMASYTPLQEERTSRYDEIWCKGRSRSALENHFSWPKSNLKKANCQELQKDVIADAEAELGYELPNHYVSATTYGTGIEWINHSKFNLKPLPLLQWSKQGELLFHPQALKSANWLGKIPVDGAQRISGQYYCKLISKTGVKALAQDLKKQDYQWVAPTFNLGSDLLKLDSIPGFSAGRIAWRSKNIFSRSHYFVANEEALKSNAKGIMVLSPGGAIPPIAMRSLALSFAKQGYLSLVLSYPANLAILEFESSVRSLSKAIKSNRGMGIAPYLQMLASDTKIYALGHSLGGAILGRVIFSDNNPFDHTFLYGAASFLNEDPSKLSQRPVTLLFGSQEQSGKGLSQEQVLDLERLFAVEKQDDNRYWNGSNVWAEEIKGINHFGILSDGFVGNAKIRAKDGQGLDVRETVQILAKAVDSYIEAN